MSSILLKSNLPQTSARFRCVTSPAPYHPVPSSRAIVTSLSGTPAPHARYHLHQGFHLTNPYAEPKGSQPNYTQRHEPKSLGHYVTHSRSRKLCFHHPGNVPVIRGHLDLHFEGAGNGPVVISWIGRDMSCTTAYLRSRSLNIESLSDMIARFYRSWDLYTTGQLVDGMQTKKQKTNKKENWVSLNGNGIMWSFLGRQFYRSTLYIYIYIYVISSQRPKTVGVDYSCIEYMRNII